MAERLARSSPATRASRADPAPLATPATEFLQTTFLAPEDASLFAELTRLRLLINEISVRCARGRERLQQVAIRTPKDVADLLMPEMQHLPQEEFRVVLLNTKNVVLDVPLIYRGTLNSSPVRLAEVFNPATLADAASLIAVHCHPSGDPTPSPEDVRVTGELVKAGKLLDIPCLDHIIGHERFTSLKERGLGSW